MDEEQPKRLLPEQLTPEVQDKILRLIRAGNHPRTAAVASGINPDTFMQWVAKADGRSPRWHPTPEQEAALTEFVGRVHQAEAEAEVLIVEKINNGFDRDPVLALKFLGRRFSKNWGDKREVNHNWRIKAVQMVQTGQVSREALEAELGPELAREIWAQIEAPRELHVIDSERARAEDETHV